MAPGSPAAHLRASNLVTYVAVAAALVAAVCTDGPASRSLAGAALAVAVVADLFDGRFARLFPRTDEQKRFGVQIDSLGRRALVRPGPRRRARAAAGDHVVGPGARRSSRAPSSTSSAPSRGSPTTTSPSPRRPASSACRRRCSASSGPRGSSPSRSWSRRAWRSSSAPAPWSRRCASRAPERRRSSCWWPGRWGSPWRTAPREGGVQCASCPE